jgi:diguanylate cyclase (GGDEF)-like protein
VTEYEPSLVGTASQCVGALLVTVLLLLQSRSTHRRFLAYWTLSWVCLLVALAALFVAFQVPWTQTWLYPVYVFAELSFGCLLVAGCRNLGSGYELSARSAWTAVALAVVAGVVPAVAPNFDLLFSVQAVLMGGLFLAAFLLLWRVRRKEGHAAGLWVMLAALPLLAAAFFHYAPLCAYAGWTGEAHAFPHLRYSALYDWFGEMVLAFGMVMLAMDLTRRDLEKMNYDLAAATLRLQVQAQEDPLTEVFNRQAFHSFMEKGRQGDPQRFSGAVAILDVDDLKPLNDRYGHAAGDAAIRAVAKAIRTVIRPDDLLFRWGGDEFLVLLFGVNGDEALARFDRPGGVFTRAHVPGAPEPVDLAVSVGVAPFRDPQGLEKAIAAADAEMYQYKSVRKRKQYRLAMYSHSAPARELAPTLPGATGQAS